jgi:hypothetical protein
MFGARVRHSACICEVDLQLFASYVQSTCQTLRPGPALPSKVGEGVGYGILSLERCTRVCGSW